MNKVKLYYKCKFSLDTVIEGRKYFLSLLEKGEKDKPVELTIKRDNETWTYDTFEEFSTEYTKSDGYIVYYIQEERRFIISGDKDYCRIDVQSKNRSEIEGVFQIFENKLEESVIINEKVPIKIFIGHGHDEQWRDLKDHLHEKQGFEVVAYEIGPRAGLSVKEILESMLEESSFALLVLTGEDVDSEGHSHARENVIHELGLFQGRIGFKRAIAILEIGVNEFSNILGINQIRFNKGNIKEAFGDVLSVIRREFEEKNL